MSTFNTVIFEQVPLVGILRNFSSQVIRQLAPHYFNAGFHTLEVTLNARDAYDSIQMLNEKYGEMNIGAGTVCTKDELLLAKKSGASFAVSPICDVNLIHSAKELDMAIFPGALTPTEIYAAWEAGATAVKLFPAGSYGQQYLKDVKGPLPKIKIVPVGGVNLDNMSRYFELGAYGVGLGGSLFNREDIHNGNFDKISLHFQNIFHHLQLCTKANMNSHSTAK